MQRIVYTRHSDGGVNVAVPSKELFQILEHGGWWNDSPIQLSDFIAKQIRLARKSGVPEESAKRFAEAVAFGGVKGEAAWDLVIDRFCRHLGHSFVRMSFSDLPDRWFRDAWRQNSNGNVTVDLDEARQIQKQKITESYIAHNAAVKETLFEQTQRLAIDVDDLTKRISGSSSIEDIRSVWPEGLPYYERRHQA